MKYFCSGFLFCLVISLSLLSGPAGAKTMDEMNNIEIYRKASPGVVNISSVVVEYDFFYRPIHKEGTGSGIVIDQLGHIVTNNHVIQDSRSLEVTLSDGSKRPAVLVGTDPGYDLAVIKIDVPEGKLKAIPMGSSKDLKVGQKVLAIGNPFGFGQTLTTGVISSLQRSIQTETGSIIKDLIQTDAAINPGNSGGPLLNSKGEIIGINTMILSPTGANVGVGFGIPVDTVKQVIPRLISGRFSYYGILPLAFFALVSIIFYIFWRQVVGRIKIKRFQNKRDNGQA
ncbi:MAG: trypsin-like serine protease [Calditrichales bacterium]|nr:MAG: trypsin-like serine protease [Calditrichales bacterium]